VDRVPVDVPALGLACRDMPCARAFQNATSESAPGDPAVHPISGREVDRHNRAVSLILDSRHSCSRAFTQPFCGLPNQFKVLCVGLLGCGAVAPSELEPQQLKW